MELNKSKDQWFDSRCLSGQTMVLSRLACQLAHGVEEAVKVDSHLTHHCLSPCDIASLKVLNRVFFTETILMLEPFDDI